MPRIRKRRWAVVIYMQPGAATVDGWHTRGRAMELLSCTSTAAIRSSGPTATAWQSSCSTQPPRRTVATPPMGENACTPPGSPLAFFGGRKRAPSKLSSTKRPAGSVRRHRSKSGTKEQWKCTNRKTSAARSS